MAEDIPKPIGWVREQAELYESSGGIKSTTLRDTCLPCVLVNHTANKSGAIRKTPLMKVKDKENYVLVGSQGGASKNIQWVKNLRSNDKVELRDATEVFKMSVREVSDDQERSRLWELAVKAYLPYEDYQIKTSRKISVFHAKLNLILVDKSENLPVYH